VTFNPEFSDGVGDPERSGSFPSFHYAKLLTYRPFKRPFGSCYKLLLGPTVVVALNSALWRRSSQWQRPPSLRHKSCDCLVAGIKNFNFDTFCLNWIHKTHIDSVKTAIGFAGDHRAEILRVKDEKVETCIKFMTGS
jgi:hypothetical protein